MTAEYTAGWNAALEAAARACEAQQAIFGSEQYAVNQPLSSFGERLACGRCAEAILALAQDAPNTSSTPLAAEGADPETNVAAIVAWLRVLAEKYRERTAHHALHFAADQIEAGRVAAAMICKTCGTEHAQGKCLGLSVRAHLIAKDQTHD